MTAMLASGNNQLDYLLLLLLLLLLLPLTMVLSVESVELES
jgi:hypothetical protein